MNFAFYLARQFLNALMVRVLLLNIKKGGGVPSIGKLLVLTTIVTSRHRSAIFKMAGKFVVRYFPNIVEFPTV